MPNNRKITKKAIKGKEGIHPGSRKAGQITRAALRTVKLQQQNKHRKGDVNAKLQRPTFFMFTLDSGSPLSLASLKAVVGVYIARHDARIQELIAERRPGRPKTMEHIELEEQRRQEEKEYESGMEVPDLTYYLTSRLLYRYIQNSEALDLSRLAMIRMVRVFKNSDEMIVTKKGNAEIMGLGVDDGSKGEDWAGGEGGGGEETGDEVMGEL